MLIDNRILSSYEKKKVEYFVCLMHIYIVLLMKGCEVVLCRAPKLFCGRTCASCTMHFTYIHAASRSASTCDFPRVTRLRNRSVSRYDDIQDDWPIAVSVPLWKIDSYWRTNWPKLTHRRTFVCHARLRYCNNFRIIKNE